MTPVAADDALWYNTDLHLHMDNWCQNYLYDWYQLSHRVLLYQNI